MATVRITYQPEAERYLAVFMHADEIVASKVLTGIEIEGLLDVIEFDDDFTLDAFQLAGLLVDAYFDNNGQATDFELMLADLIALQQ